MRSAFLVAGMTIACTAIAQGPVARTTDTTRPIDLFRAAIDSPSGRVKTQVHGPMAQQVQQAIGAPGTPVYAEVTTISSFKQEGCKRLALTLSAPEHMMKLSDGRSAPFRGTWTLNVCRDGSPPMEAVDLSKVSKVLEKDAAKPIQLEKAR